MIEEKDLIDVVLNCVTNGKSLSVIRCGDGEMLAMNSLDKEAAGDIENVPFLKHIGYIPDRKMKEWLIEDMRKAISECDILGITQNTGKNWGKTRQFFLEMADGKETANAGQSSRTAY